MNLIKPNKLKSGDTIAIIATSGNVDLEKINIAKEYLENKGYKVKLGKNINKELRYLAGSDEDRLEDLHWAFSNKNIDAILCARGGYGAIRLINKIDYEIIKNNPKIFCGFSDITALNAMFLKKSNLITFSGPMAQSDFSNETIDEYTQNEFFKTLQNNNIQIKTSETQILKEGNAEGILFGGNLATLASLCGQEFIPDENFIFFAEDLNENAYKIDKYITQLLNIPTFKKNIKAILLGDFLDIDNENYLNEIFKDIANDLNIPAIKGYPFTHKQRKATIPYGAFASLENNIIKVSNFMV